MAAYASKPFSAGDPVPTTWLLVSDAGFLHFVPNVKKQIKHVSDSHGLRNGYVRNMLGLDQTDPRDEHKHWQLLGKVRGWLRHISSGVIIVVVGDAKHFFDNQAAICESAGLASDALHFTSHRVLQRLLADVRAARIDSPFRRYLRHDRRGVEGKVQVSVGPRSANAEGEDQLWRHALEEVSRSADANFLAFISDTDFKEAALVLLPRRLFPDGAALPTGHIFVASIDRSAPQTQQYWCMNELITAVARSPALADGIPGGPAPLVRTLAAAQRLRCGHLAAALVLMGGDTTPSIHGLTEQVGVSLVCAWAWYTGPLVEAYTHHLSGLEVFKLIPEAVLRLHKVWYVLRSTPNIQKELKYNAQRGREAQRAWFDGWTLEQIATKVIDKVPPVGVAGQPVRTAANLLILTTVANARLLQWGLAPCPDASLFAARDGLRAVDGGQCGPWNTELDWDLTEVGKKAPGPRAGPVATPAKLSALELFRKYQNDLRGVDTLPQT
jgi:hypothetical protein